ncbi:MAG: hypothetical protein A2097_09905 [Desulfobacula sp. GWF2_41_7]|nr:MAG: hypothetical protein A2097_09905 [Desulfobacula sp. GWF2_41_7]
MANPIHTVLYVDDEEPIIASVKRLFRKEKFNLMTASSGEQGLEILKNNKIHLVISDQRMPQMSGTEFLTRVKANYPDTMRILLTGYTEINSIQEAINKGNIYKFLLKPWKGEDLKAEVYKTLEAYDLIQAGDSGVLPVPCECHAPENTDKNPEQPDLMQTKGIPPQNICLELANEIFRQMPIPVVFIGTDKTILLAGKKAQQIVINNKKFVEGQSILNYFSKRNADKISALFTSGKKITINQKINNRDSMIQCYPLTGKFSGKGIILYFLPDLSITGTP